MLNPGQALCLLKLPKSDCNEAATNDHRFCSSEPWTIPATITPPRTGTSSLESGVRRWKQFLGRKLSETHFQKLVGYSRQCNVIGTLVDIPNVQHHILVYILNMVYLLFLPVCQWDEENLLLSRLANTELTGRSVSVRNEASLVQTALSRTFHR